MMNDRARLWSKRKSAPFADPRDEERALREMRKSIDHSFNFNIDFNFDVNVDEYFHIDVDICTINKY